MKKAESMGLHDLRKIENPTQLFRGLRDLDGHNRIAGFGRGYEMRNGANAANARHQRRHFIKRTAFAQLLKAPKLSHMEMSRLHGPVLIQLDGDLGVAFDARDRINNDIQAAS